MRFSFGVAPALLLVAGCYKPIVAPELRPDVGPAKAFVYLRPVGWKAEGTLGGGGMGGSIEISEQMATVRIGADLVGSLMADIAAASNSQVQSLADAVPGMAERMPKTKPPVESLHEKQATTVGQKMEDFADTGPAETLAHPTGAARRSEFTGKRNGSKLRGWRVTILGGDKRYSVRCQCRQDDWETLKPAFEKIIQSVGPAPEP